MVDLWQTLIQLVEVLLRLLGELIQLALSGALLIAWVAWWLWGVNWNKAWAVLAEGAWVPVVFLLLVAALVWSQLAPSECACLGFVRVPNFWWQLGGVGLLAALTLFCGWLQGLLGWTPAEISLDPPSAPGPGHGHH